MHLQEIFPSDQDSSKSRHYQYSVSFFGRT